jgi:hypothetical protein
VLTRRGFIGITSGAIGSVVVVASLSGCRQRDTKKYPKGAPMFVRISMGHFDPAIHDDIERTLREGGARLIPHINKLAGCIHYYAAINREASTIVNVSIWDSLEHAEQMSSLPAMADEGNLMRSKGLRFDPIINYESVWTITA